MQSLRLKIAAFRPIQLLMIAVVCVVLFLGSVMPAYAISSTPSDPRSGETSLDEIFERSEDALRAEPRTMKQLESEASKGINEVQGDADLNSSQMNRPDNSQNATSAEEQVENVLRKLTHKE
ncbi:MAG: hypothetical protein SFY66_07940 [Oculatellaceae cyanobacterium bins.114]|nr:hypothetical protein [Oculatellaceae cyanobacterium bins.114]